MCADQAPTRHERPDEPADSWAMRGLGRPTAELSAVRDIVARVQELLAWDNLPDLENLTSFSAANAALSSISALTSRSLQGDVRSGDQLISRDTLIDLLVETEALGERLHRAELDYWSSAYRKVHEALARLRGADSVSSLIKRAAESVPLLGFDRCGISRIDHGYWAGERFFIENDQEWSDEIFNIWQENPVKMDSSLMETEILRRKTALLVPNAQDNPRCRNPIIETNRTRSYVGAPIMPQGEVIGFMHADCYGQCRHTDELDRDVLAMFTEGLGYALQRTMLLERLESLRSQVDGLAGGITSAVDDCIEKQMEIGETFTEGEERVGLRPPLIPFQSETNSIHNVTPRERDVLRLMAAGETNARIASRLVISDSTVKSHIKNILRKLNASNRAEAVSRYLRMER